MPELRGVLPVIQTPFHPDDRIDLPSLAEEIAWAIAQGVDGFTVAMVSEYLRLNDAERLTLASAVIHAAGALPVVVSVGAESTHLAVTQAQAAEACGAAALMAIPPVSVAVSEDELGRYYEAILTAVQVPLVVQDASGYVGTPLSIAVQAGLLEQFGDRVLFKPEAEPIGPRLSALREATNGRARVFEGTGGIALVDSFRRGIVGTMPAVDVCWALVALWRALEADDETTAYAISGPLAGLVSLQQGSLDAFVAVEKYLLVRQGVIPSARQRGPLGYVLDRETRDEVDRLFERLRAAVPADR